MKDSDIPDGVFDLGDITPRDGNAVLTVLNDEMHAARLGDDLLLAALPPSFS